MDKYILALALVLVATYSTALEYTIVKTGSAVSLEGLVYEQGSYFKKMPINHSAFLIQHKGNIVAFEMGLSSHIDEEFSSEMPFWAKPIFGYKKGRSLFQQIKKEHSPTKVFLSHTHWDHASGLRDYKDINFYIAKEEAQELSELNEVRSFRSHFKDNHPIYFQWQNKKSYIFEKSYDVFGDGKVILVPLFGHTHGSSGLILDGEEKIFLVGDAIWTTRQLDPVVSKSYIGSALVDTDKKEALETISKIQEMKRLGFKIIPTHDYYTQEKIGYYPKWNSL